MSCIKGYLTTTVRDGEYEAIATQHVYDDGKREGGYLYVVLKSGNIVDLGSVSWGKIEKEGFTNLELLKHIEKVRRIE